VIVAVLASALQRLSPEHAMRTLLLLLVLLSTLTLAGCELVGDIFQAGMAVGIIVVVLLIAGLAFLGRKIFS
jgi:hypothetical protein